MTGDIVKEYSSNNWYAAFADINREVRKFKKRLGGITIEQKAVYLDEWNELFLAISEEYEENPNITYDKVTHHLFGNPATLEDFLNEILCVVPPVNTTTAVKRSTT